MLVLGTASERFNELARQTLGKPSKSEEKTPSKETK